MFFSHRIWNKKLHQKHIFKGIEDTIKVLKIKVVQKSRDDNCARGAILNLDWFLNYQDMKMVRHDDLLAYTNIEASKAFV
jgi:hypothetical protein